MTRVTTAIRRYPLVAATVLVAVVALTLTATPARDAVPWLVSGHVILVAARMFIGMVRDLLAGHTGVDILALMAITAALAVGEYWAALVIVLMLTGGEAIEEYAAGRATKELTALLERAPQIAHQLRDDGTMEDVPVEDVAVGDLIVVKPAEVVPVDAVLVDSSGIFDESSLTGESLPVERGPGDAVLSGVLNGQTAVTLRATASAADSQYAGIIALVEEARNSRSRVVRLADRFAVPFTLLAILIAGLAWWLSGDSTRVAAVLVVATPCPLIIAAPVAYMGGMSRAAKSSIIVKNAATLEQLSAARTVAFDKTGTLTRGQPTLDRFEAAPGVDADRALRLAASAEQYSSHVLAATIVDSAVTTGIELALSDQAEEIATHGVTAVIDGVRVVVGKRSFVEDAAGEPLPDVPISPGEQAAYVAIDGAYSGVLFLRDEVRANSRSTIAELHDLGVQHVMMLTGDAQATAIHVAEELGIDDVRAECLPADKVRAIAEVSARPVIMVGDGINDAPVLAAADVGIAMGARGATAASESADAVLLIDDVSRVSLAVAIGRRTMRVALQSIWAGILLSTGLMAVAAFGALPPLAGAWLQEVVDLIVILAALRALTPGRRQRRAGV